MISFWLSQYWEGGFNDCVSFAAGDVGLGRATPALPAPSCRQVSVIQSNLHSPPDLFVLPTFQGSRHAAVTASSVCFQQAKKKVEYIICSQSQCKY